MVGNSPWFEDVAALEAALTDFAPRGRILELAGGTGIWSEKLLPFTRELTVVDGSPESLRRNRARLGSAAVRYIEADLFAWQPEQRFDIVFFSFWLSHVPDSLFGEFWRLVESCLGPAGRVFFIDSVRQQTSTSVDQSVPSSGEFMARKLNDGRAFRVFKTYYDPDGLEQRLGGLGYFIGGSAERTGV